MTAHERAGAAAKIIRDAMTGNGPQPSEEARTSAIDAIERAIAARKRRARLRVVAGAVGIAAAAAAIVLTVRFAVHHAQDATASTAPNAPAGPVMLAHPEGVATVTPENGAPSALRDGDVVPQGSHLTTPPGSRVALKYPSGTELTLRGGGDMSVVEDGKNRIYALGRGALDLHVAKLSPTERLLVRTSDAEVEVRGTRFHVEVLDPATSCDRTAATKVTVDEGVVVVRNGGGEVKLTAGETWPACAKTAALSAPSNPLPAQAQTQTPSATIATASPVAPSIAASPSSLEEQNDAFQDGVDKKRRGDTAGALHAFDRLLAKYPNGPLAESAAAERLKILRTQDSTRARTAAREYLARWPKGFAREDAESVLRDAP